MDPEVKRYFRKIMNSFVYGLLWMLFVSTAGLYMRFGWIVREVRWYNIVFYGLALGTLLLLLRFLYKTWKI